MKHTLAKRFLIATVIASTAAVPAFAADMPLRPAPAAPPAWSWEGFYLGAYAGGLWGHVNTGRTDTSQVVSNRPSGAALGEVIGYNHEWNGVVLGLEGDAGWTNASHTTSYVSATSGAPETELDKSTYTAHVRGRVGLPFTQWLPFIAGGASFTNDKMTLTHTASFLTPGTITQDWVGWNIGGGIDYAFTSHWIGRVEYIYDDFGKKTYGFNAYTSGQFTDRVPKLTQNTVRALISYRF